MANKMLDKMRMPKKKEMDLDMEELHSGEAVDDPEMEPAEDTMDADAEMEEPVSKQNKELEALSDEELLAEIRKRGLMSELENDESQEMYS